MVKRRTFIKGIAATILGTLGISKAKKNTKPFAVIRTASQAPANPKITIGKSCNDICNEALEKIGEIYLHRLSSRQEFIIGTCFVRNDGQRFRYTKMPTGSKILGKTTTRPIWHWTTEWQFYENTPQEFYEEITMAKSPFVLLKIS